MDAGRGRGRGRGRGVAAAGRGAAAVGAAGRGAAGRGAAARGGRGAGRGGRGAGRGLPEAEVSAESAAPSVGTASVTQSVPLAGGANLGAGGGAAAGVGGDAGVGAAPGGGGAALAQGDLIVGLLTQLLARLPEAVPQQAPVAPPAAGAQFGAGFVQQQAAGFEQQQAAGFGQQGAAVGVLPAYREAMREMQRIGTPTFEGGVTPEQADEWRLRLERNFESVRCPEQFQVEIAVHYLSGDAHFWWRSVRTRRTDWAWVDFVEEFNYRFFPQEARDRLQSRFLELVQGDRSVREYDAEFSRLLAYSGEYLTERSLMGKFLRGLRQDIKGQCRGKVYHTRFELVELAASTEEDLREPVRAAVVPAAVVPATQPRGQQQHQQRRNFRSGYGRGGRPQSGQKRSADQMSASVQSSGACFGCGSFDHRVYACPKRAGSGETVCFHCRETGHIRTYCPKLQQRTVGSVAAVQPLAIQSAAQVAALQPGSGGAPRVYTPQEAGQTSQSGQITGIIFDPDFVNS